MAPFRKRDVRSRLSFSQSCRLSVFGKHPPHPRKKNSALHPVPQIPNAQTTTDGRRLLQLCESTALGSNLCERLAQGVDDLGHVGRALDDLREGARSVGGKGAVEEGVREDAQRRPCGRSWDRGKRGEHEQSVTASEANNDKRLAQTHRMYLVLMSLWRPPAMVMSRLASAPMRAGGATPSGV